MEKVIYALQSKKIIRAINYKEAIRIINLADKYGIETTLTEMNGNYFVALKGLFKVNLFK